MEKAIVCHSMSCLDFAIQEKHYESLCCHIWRLSPIELAIGWSDGLQKLLDAGFDEDTGLHLAVWTNDLTSAMDLLVAENVSISNDVWKTVFYQLSESCEEMQKLVT